MSKTHLYNAKITWTGNTGKGTTGYREYERSHVWQINGKQEIHCSSDPAFLGDPGKHNPEDMLLASLSSCHMLWYLHLCADAGIVVTHYEDQASGIMQESESGGKFISATLRPVVTITDKSRKEEAIHLHERANKKCFIANSVNFPVQHDVTII